MKSAVELICESPSLIDHDRLEDLIKDAQHGALEAAKAICNEQSESLAIKHEMFPESWYHHAKAYVDAVASNITELQESL